MTNQPSTDTPQVVSVTDIENNVILQQFKDSLVAEYALLSPRNYQAHSTILEEVENSTKHHTPYKPPEFKIEDY